MARVARLNAATLASLAAAPGPPANVRILTKDLENDSTLTWEASPGGLAAGYEVLWRATTSPEWEHAQKVVGATRVTLKFSKDNVIFAVRAADKAGHRSLAVVPVPEFASSPVLRPRRRQLQRRRRRERSTAVDRSVAATGDRRRRFCGRSLGSVG